MRQRLDERTLRSNEGWQALEEDVVADPAGVDVVAALDRVQQDHSVEVVRRDVAVPGKILRHHQNKFSRLTLTLSTQHKQVKTILRLPLKEFSSLKILV